MEKTNVEKTEIVLNLFNKGRIIPGEVQGVSMFDESTDILVFFYKVDYNTSIFLDHTVGASKCIDNEDAVTKHIELIYNALVANDIFSKYEK